MRITTLALALIASVLCSQFAVAQSTISCKKYELSAGVGPWGVFLPSYNLGTNTTSGGPAYFDDLDDVGGAITLRGIRRFIGTRTSFESRTIYAYADSSDSRVGTINFTDPVSGGLVATGGGAARLDSKVDHYGTEFLLRDTWKTRFGGLSAGVAFGFMSFDQEFDVDYSATDLFREDLDSEFTGGKAVFGWDGCLRGRASNLDLAVGFYDVEADYRAITQYIAGNSVINHTDSATTFEASFTTRSQIRGYNVSLTTALLYISDMPMIDHTPGGPASIGTDDATTLTAAFEILLR